MEKDVFDKYIEEHSGIIGEIRAAAHKAHDDVNQRYDKVWPYGVHLDAVAENVITYGGEICAAASDILPMVFGAYFHDAIEDARLTYNDIMHLARGMMDEAQAYTAAEIVYALTNEKGRTRAERADDRYYEGIRTTPYAPLCKMADRMANVGYSSAHPSEKNKAMRNVYAREMPHFIESIMAKDTADRRSMVPEAMINDLEAILQKQ